jgi:hypothetical protein
LAAGVLSAASFFRPKKPLNLDHFFSLSGGRPESVDARGES